MSSSHALDSDVDEKNVPEVVYAGSHKHQASITATPVDRSNKYPTGIRAALILTALCLALFLISLDMVRCFHDNSHATN